MAHRTKETPDLASATARVPDHVVHRSLAHETVVLNLTTGRYHGLNPTAGRMLTELESGAPLREISVRLAELYGVPAPELEADLSELCLDLLERGLIELFGADGQPLATDASGGSG